MTTAGARLRCVGAEDARYSAVPARTSRRRDEAGPILRKLSANLEAAFEPTGAQAFETLLLDDPELPALPVRALMGLLAA